MKRLLLALLLFASPAFGQETHFNANNGPDQRAHASNARLNTGRLGVIQTHGAKYVPKVCSGYTLQPTDSGTQIQCSDAGAATITLPSNLPLTFQVAIEQNGAGQITVSAGSGATLHAPHSFAGKTAGQYSIIGLSIDATSAANADVYILSGDGA